MRRIAAWLFCVTVVSTSGCGGNSPAAPVPTDSEVAASVVGGALNNVGGTLLGWGGLPRTRTPLLERILDDLRPVRSAHAASWTCTGGTLAPSFAGPSHDPYTFTPVSCSVTFLNGKTTSSTWSGSFTLDYGSSCDGTHPWIGNQVASCSVTRRTSAGGNTRTITGPEGNSYAVTHDTNGASTGWDATVSPAPSNAGVIVTCGASGCSGSSGSATLAVSGSHLTGTVAVSGQGATRVWDHTVSTPAPLTISGAGTSRVVSGTVIVQHNLARYTATSTFDHVGFGQLGCCFPTTGTVTTSFGSGPNAGKTEKIAFDATCGEATLTTVDGATVPITLLQCL